MGQQGFWKNTETSRKEIPPAISNPSPALQSRTARTLGMLLGYKEALRNEMSTEIPKGTRRKAAPSPRLSPPELVKLKASHKGSASDFERHGA